MPVFVFTSIRTRACAMPQKARRSACSASRVQAAILATDNFHHRRPPCVSIDSESGWSSTKRRDKIAGRRDAECRVDRARRQVAIIARIAGSSGLDVSRVPRHSRIFETRIPNEATPRRCGGSIRRRDTRAAVDANFTSDIAGSLNLPSRPVSWQRLPREQRPAK